MCGFTVIIKLSGSGKLASSIKVMTDSLKHRGPDDEGFVLFEDSCIVPYAGQDTIKIHEDSAPDYFPKRDIESAYDSLSTFAFGHRRLSIIDLSSRGHQPMNYMGRYWIVYNGEIYNYLELRKDLESIGFHFNTETDTEVIMAAYHAWGTECLSRFNGMWSFCIYDLKRKVFFVSRDRFGVKPLLYFQNDDYICFASEAKAFIANHDLVVGPNYEYLKNYIKSGFNAFGEDTAFAGVKSVLSGTYCEFDLTNFHGVLNFLPFYRLQDSSSNLDYEVFLGEYFKLLQDAVRLRLRSDVSVGTCLSGGLDSSSVTYMVNEQLIRLEKAERQKTFSLVFQSNRDLLAYDESRFINLMSSEYNLNSYLIEPNVRDVLEIYEKAVYHFDFPQDSSLMSAIFTYKLVSSEGVHVTLDGQGSDEINGGYLHYLRNYFSNLSVSQIVNEYSQFNKIPGAKFEIILGIFFKIVKMLQLKRPVNYLLRLLGKNSDPFISVNQHLLVDFQNNLQNLLHIGDRASMMFSVETRFPFLDFRLVELLFKQPVETKLRNGWTKYSLRQIFNDRLPNSIVWRRDKMGWEIPEREWLLGKMKDQIMITIGRSNILRIIGSIKSADKIIKKKKHTYREFRKLVRYYNLAIWENCFFNETIK